MRPILLDTNAYAAFKKSNKDVVEVIQYAEEIAISPIVLGELCVGFDGGKIAKQNKAELQQFLESTRVKIYPITYDTAIFYSQVFLSLKKKGRPIPTNDIWIAAQALEQGCVLCTFDAHFQEIDGLIIGNTSIELIT